MSGAEGRQAQGRRVGRVVLLRWLAVVLAQMALLGTACGLELTRMQRVSSDASVPPSSTAAWTSVALPDAQHRPAGSARLGAAWYRARFQGPRPGDAQGHWAVYLPYLYDGGEIWLNGIRVGGVQEGSDSRRVRWERAHLLQLPRELLHEGDNELAIRAAAAAERTVRRFPIVSVGQQSELQTRHDRRQFWVRTMPQITVVVCLLMAAIVLFIWWRRRAETLYGLFGLATALWGIRTLTFVIESMPTSYWHLWRIVYLGATGGCIVVLALFALRLARLDSRPLRRALLAYWAVGPVWLLLAGPAHEAFINQWWSAGLIPIGLGIMAVSLWDLLRQRTLASAAMPAALVLAVMAGIHDYQVSWDEASLARWAPHWVAQRIFLLHHGANLVLLCMGGLLAARFVHTIDSLEELNHTLELRVADRERHLAANFERMAELQRQHAAARERQVIMRDIHDGLGSRLFTSLSRVERGDMSEGQIADVLRECIADMRIALDALNHDVHDFGTALGNFLFRWQAQLGEAGIRPSWNIEVPDDAKTLTPQSSLQLLRIAQEALTNVLKHSRATQVQVNLRQTSTTLDLEIVDNGIRPETAEHVPGHGIGSMQARARALGARLQVETGHVGTRVALCVPLNDPTPGIDLPA